MSKGSRGSNCAESITLVGNDSGKNARQFMKLEAGTTMIIRQRIEVSRYWTKIPRLPPNCKACQPILFSKTTMSQELGPLGPWLHSCKVDMKLI